MQPTVPCATTAWGAAASQAFMAPHSSDSTWPNAIQRSCAGGSTCATAAEIDGNMARGPQWKSSGSSASIRNWLKVNPAGGAISGTKVESR
jgi:hypothetical protein